MEQLVPNADYQLMVEVGDKQIKFDYVGHFTVGGKTILSIIREDNRAYFYEGQEGVTHEDTIDALNRILSEGMVAQAMQCVNVGDGFYDVECANNKGIMRLHFQEVEDSVFNFYKIETL